MLLKPGSQKDVTVWFLNIAIEICDAFTGFGESSRQIGSDSSFTGTSFATGDRNFQGVVVQVSFPRHFAATFRARLFIAGDALLVCYCRTAAGADAISTRTASATAASLSASLTLTLSSSSPCTASTGFTLLWHKISYQPF
jgi:hypothetical protein